MRRDHVLSQWLTETPAWARDNPRFVRLFRWLRWSVAAWAVIALCGGTTVYMICT